MSQHFDYYIAAAVLLATILYANRRRSNSPLPPGPPGKMLLGNVLQYPEHHPWLTFAEWAKEYGAVIHLRMINQNFVILNSSKAALDLLETRSNIYSDRPRSYLMDEMIKQDKVVFRARYDHPRFKAYRRMMHSGLSPRAVRDYQPLQIQETNTLLLNLVKTPEKFRSHIRRNAGAVIMKVAYGYEVTTDDDFFVKLVETSFQVTERVLSSPYMVEFFPILRYVPSWFPFFRHWEATRLIKEHELEHVPFDWAKKSIDSGNYVDSFVSRFLRPESGPAPSEEDQDILKFVSAALYIGGADTTVAALTSFFYLMETHPDIQRRAQAEVDSVTGGSRLPTPDDESKMPYITAIIKEIIRWSPVAPLGLPHRVMQDDIYENTDGASYLIPEGSTVMANIWAIVHDSELYPNPDAFDPDRHLGDKPQPDPFKFVFGFGRRVCPGAYLAQRSLFLSIANILAVFDLEMHQDQDGKPIEPEAKFSSGITSHLLSFPCKIAVRASHLLPTA